MRRSCSSWMTLALTLCFALPSFTQTRTFVAYVGPYSAATIYHLNDLVSSDSKFYISLAADNLGNSPESSSSRWALLSSASTGAGISAIAGDITASGTGYVTSTLATVNGSAGTCGDATHVCQITTNAKGLTTAQTAIAISVVQATGPRGADGPAGPIGLTGAAGTAGSIGPAGASGTAGSIGPAGTAGPIGLAGAAGPIGLEGTAGTAGTAGPIGLAGTAGAVGPIGPAGTAGAVGTSGAIGPSGPPVMYVGTYASAVAYSIGSAVSEGGSAYVSLVATNLGHDPSSSPAQWGVLAGAGAPAISSLYGKKFALFADSIGQILGNYWQSQLIARTGMIEVYQNALGGRKTADIFADYQGPGGTFKQISDPTGYLGTTTGNTLVQDLAAAAPDVIIIALGTNDANTPLGSPGDAKTAHTLYGNILNAVDTIAAARPTSQILWITPYQYSTAINFGGPYATNEAIVTAIKTVCGQYGVTVNDILHNGTLNQYNWGIYLNDGLHISPAGADAFYVPHLIAKLKEMFY